MKRSILILAILVPVLMLAVAPLASADSGDETVYVTKTGAKYHRESCSYLRRSSIPMKLSEAAARYGPCSRCSPPTLKESSDDEGDDEDLEAVKEKEPAKGKAGAAEVKTPAKKRAPSNSSGRCQATTKKGTQCSRRAQAGRSYCWQHGR